MTFPQRKELGRTLHMNIGYLRIFRNVANFVDAQVFEEIHLGCEQNNSSVF
jgi:hypothetical protein